jgi:NYN domain
VDRCALFVDAGYVLADGATAVHGTRRGESVAWDCEGLVRLLSSLARERTGLPLLRCYWYEATVDGRRTTEQDALADVPGIKLRVAKIRPGRREGVETEIHRDLTTLARNNAISDALVVSAEEDLAQVIADVQDLGMRVTVVHIAVDGNWTISRALRQESDDLIEIGGEQLRPYVELIARAGPDRPDEQDGTDWVPGRTLANGHSAVAGMGSYQPLSAGPADYAPPAIYTAPAVAEYQWPAQQLPRPAVPEDTREEGSRDDRPHQDRAAQGANGEVQSPSRQDVYVGPASTAPSRQEHQEPGAQNPAARSPGSGDAVGYSQGQHGAPEPVPGLSGLSGVPGLPEGSGPEAAQTSSGQLRRLPSRPASLGSVETMGPAPSGQHAGQGQGSARSAPYSGPQPVATSAPGPGYQSAGGVSLADAVQAAHEEGQEFGGSVARDAPALWLEAVLARKPRMPSDLEARLLQGSALPIDFLLHDEVRHALRRGFWDALERTRR